MNCVKCSYGKFFFTKKKKRKVEKAAELPVVSVPEFPLDSDAVMTRCSRWMSAGILTGARLGEDRHTHGEHGAQHMSTSPTQQAGEPVQPRLRVRLQHRPLLAFTLYLFTASTPENKLRAN